MVSGNQIVYETYLQKLNKDIEFDFINYVSNGQYPVLEERKGVFHLNPLAYVENYSDSWLNHRQV